MSKRSIDDTGTSTNKLRKTDILEVTSIEHFKDLINSSDGNSKDYMVFDFYAAWCPPCRRIGTRLHDLAEAFPSAQFYKVDRDRCMDVHKACSVQKIPTFIVYDTSNMNEPMGKLQHSDYDTVYKFLEETMIGNLYDDQF